MNRGSDRTEKGEPRYPGAGRFARIERDAEYDIDIAESNARRGGR